VSYISGDDLLERAREDNVQFIRLQFTDVLGVFKNIAITKDELRCCNTAGRSPPRLFTADTD
jgi:glutamine synthetase